MELIPWSFVLEALVVYSEKLVQISGNTIKLRGLLISSIPTTRFITVMMSSLQTEKWWAQVISYLSF